MPRRAPNSPGSGKRAKIQRLIDLIAALLAHRMPLTFEQLVAEVPAYGGKGRAAQKRMFERDKLELRAFGVPIQTVGEEGSDESAYTIATRDFYLPYLALATPRGMSAPHRVDRYGYRALPTLTFEPDELAAIDEAASCARALGDPALEAEVESGLRKLAFDLPVGGSVAADEQRVLPQRATADSDVLHALWQALVARKRVAIEYRSMSTDAHTQRTVEPYGLFFLNGHWYLAARDVEKDAVRNFRVSRIQRAAPNSARQGTADYAIPVAFDLRVHARSRQAWELGDGEPIEVTVELRSETGAAMAAVALGRRVPGARGRWSFRVRRRDAFVRWLLSFAGEVVPVAPPDVVAEYRELIARTRAVYDAPAETR
jgi:predicted DNA-binding transcriptional regulator YafY